MSLNAYNRKDSSQINKLTSTLRSQKKKEQNKSKAEEANNKNKSRHLLNRKQKKTKQQRKIKETRRWFLENVNESDKSVA